MNKDVEQALFDHVAQKPDLSVDDMLWWLYDNYKLVVGTRTIRRAFERRNTSHKKFRNDARKDMRTSRDSVANLTDPDSPQLTQLHGHAQSNLEHADVQPQPQPPPTLTQSANTYQSPYAPMAPMVSNAGPSDISPELARALGGLTHPNETNIHPDLMSDDMSLSEDEETLQLQLQQIALQKREVELKLKMRRLQRANRSSLTPRLSTDSNHHSFMPDMGTDADAGASNQADQDNPHPDDSPPQKHRDSRSKSKVEEAKRRTEERQERMLKDLERRSRRREHLTAEWVQVRLDASNNTTQTR